ncbi:hypothetical protein GCM10027189_02260 [Rufibacter soli]
MSAVVETNQVPQANLARAKAETRKNASALRCLNQVPQVPALPTLTNHRRTAPVTGLPAPVHWEPARRLTVKAVPADQAAHVQVAVATREIVRRVAQASDQEDRASVREAHRPLVLS